MTACLGAVKKFMREGYEPSEEHLVDYKYKRTSTLGKVTPSWPETMNSATHRSSTGPKPNYPLDRSVKCLDKDTQVRQLKTRRSEMQGLSQSRPDFEE